jgi:hypothetical protein
MLSRLRNLLYSLRLLASVALLLVGFVASAQAQGAHRTIVGAWGESRAVCEGPPMMGKLYIRPMSLVEDELACDFDSVRRDGATVTWRGMCEGGGDRWRVVVTATERAGRLTILANGQVMREGLRRC